MTLQPLSTFLLLTKNAVTAASAATVPKTKIVGLTTVELPLPVRAFNPETTLYARALKKLSGFDASPEPIWSPNAKESIIAAIVPIVFRTLRAALSLYAYESVTNTRKELERDFENGTESLNGKESATPLARLEMLDCISLTEKLSRAFLIDSTNREVESKKGHVSAKFSVMLCARPTTSDSVAEMFSERNLPADLLMLSVMPARLSEIPLNPVKTLLATSDIAGDSANPLDPVKSLLTTSEGTRLSNENFAAPLLTLSVIEETRLSESPLNPVKALDAASEMVGLSVRERNPVKSLAIASEIVGLSVSPLNPAKILLAASETGMASVRDFTTPLFTTSAIADARFSDVLLKPAKTLVAASDTVGDSASPLNPVKSLLAASERAGVSERNLPADLLMLSVMPARLSDMLLNPVKTLLATSDIVGDSANPLDPVKSLLTTSEGTTLSDENFPAPLLTVSDNAETRLSENPLNPVKALDTESDTVGDSATVRNPPNNLVRLSESDRDSAMLAVWSPPLLIMSAIVDARFSVRLLNPVKTLPVVSDTVGASDRVLNPVKTLPMTSEMDGFSPNPLNLVTSLLATSETEGASEMNLAADLLIVSEMVDDRFSVSPLIMVFPLETMSEMVGLSASALAPLKSLAMASDTVGLSVKLLNPVKTLAAASDTVGASDSVLNPVRTLLTASETVGLSARVLNPANTLFVTSEIVGASDTNLLVPLPTKSDIVDARLSDVLLNPVKTLVRASDTVGLSRSERTPAKTLPMTSAGKRLSSETFPAPLLTVSVIAETRLSDRPLVPVKTLAKTSEIVGVSVSPLNPVKSLLTASEIETTSERAAEKEFPETMLSVTNLTLVPVDQRNSYTELPLLYDAVSVSDVTDSSEANVCSDCHDEPPSVDTL